ncbi:MAG: LuxR C-terminal-related transcriptional regulator [Haloechinothrix sp.]
MGHMLDLRQAVEMAALASVAATEHALANSLWPALTDLVGPVRISWWAGGMTGSTCGCVEGVRGDTVVLADLRTPCRVEFCRHDAVFSQEEFEFLQLLRPHLLAALDRVERCSASLQLTGREQQALGLAALGYTDGAIAHRLGVSARTVGRHLEHAYRKFGVHARHSAEIALVGHNGS